MTGTERTRLRFGYLVWGVAFFVTIVPELLAAWHVTERWLPFPTISRTVGHLEVVSPAWEILPTFLIVLFVYALLRVPIPALGAQPSDAAGAGETDEAQPSDVRAFVVRAVLCGLLLAAVGVGASHIWPDQHLAGTTNTKLPNFYVSYCFWGTTFVVWMVLPTITAVLGRRHSFASLPKTIVELEQMLARKGRVGRGGAWTLGFVLVWGMAFLLLHLTLYPFPDITRQLNIHEGAGLRQGQGLRAVGRRRRWDDCGGGGSVPVIHSAARGGPECLAGLEGSIKLAAVSRLAGGERPLTTHELARAAAVHRRAGRRRHVHGGSRG